VGKICLPAASLIDSLARIGFIITLFSLGVTFAEARGVNFPAIVSDWTSAAWVLGLVLIAVEVVLPQPTYGFQERGKIRRPQCAARAGAGSFWPAHL
jgi:hypothetical protein